MAQQAIQWESPDAEALADRLYERINFLTIQASAQLAREKGSYPMFAGSDWHNGRYFRDRGYSGAAWDSLAREVARHGLRNGWLLAVAPNMSTAQIAGSTASIDPIYSAFYYEEKKDFRRPVAAPGLSLETWPYYEKGACKVDQFASVRQNARRQRHVDQSISFNLRAQHHPRQHAAGVAPERLARRPEDHLLRALQRHRHQRMRVVFKLTTGGHR